MQYMKNEWWHIWDTLPTLTVGGDNLCFLYPKQNKKKTKIMDV